MEGDEIEVATWPVYNDCRLRIDRRFQIQRKSDGETLLRALLHYVCIDLQTGKAKRMPPEFTQYVVLPDVTQRSPARRNLTSPALKHARST